MITRTVKKRELIVMENVREVFIGERKLQLSWEG